MNKEIILILDFGSSYTQLIAQRIRENHVFSKVVPYNISAKEIQLLKPKGIIFSGDSSVAQNKKLPMPDKAIFKLNIPILGIGYGMQVIVQTFGGRAKPAKMPKFQRCELFIDETRGIFSQMPSNITCWMSQGEHITKLPPGFKKIAHTQDISVTAIENASKKISGLGFHPEVVATQRGNQILSNFLYKICRAIGAWTMSSFMKETLSEVKKTVGKGKVILRLTPTLTSVVMATFLNRVIKGRLKCILIDDGLLRQNEAKHIKKALVRNFKLNIKSLDRSKRFLQSLKGVVDPGEKRRVVQELSEKVFQEELKKTKGTAFLAQETLYSVSTKSSSPKKMPARMKLLEPLKSLFKEEVKIIAKDLNIPDEIISEQPFPEAGLALRILGEVTATRLKLVREAEDYLVDEIRSAGLYEEIWQSFAVLIPAGNIIALRCVASTAGMNAEWVRLPYDIIDKVAKKILSKVKGVSRVVYDVSSRPPTPIEWE